MPLRCILTIQITSAIRLKNTDIFHYKSVGASSCHLGASHSLSVVSFETLWCLSKPFNLTLASVSHSQRLWWEGFTLQSHLSTVSSSRLQWPLPLEIPGYLWLPWCHIHSTTDSLLHHSFSDTISALTRFSFPWLEAAASQDFPICFTGLEAAGIYFLYSVITLLQPPHCYLLR